MNKLSDVMVIDCFSKWDRLHYVYIKDLGILKWYNINTIPLYHLIQNVTSRVIGSSQCFRKLSEQDRWYLLTTVATNILICIHTFHIQYNWFLIVYIYIYYIVIHFKNIYEYSDLRYCNFFPYRQDKYHLTSLYLSTLYGIDVIFPCSTPRV